MKKTKTSTIIRRTLGLTLVELLQELNYKGSKTLKRKLNKYAKNTKLKSQDIKHIHQIYLLTMWTALIFSIGTIYPKLTIQSLIIFLTLFTIMHITWFIYVECPLTLLENKIKQRETK